MASRRNHGSLNRPQAHKKVDLRPLRRIMIDIRRLLSGLTQAIGATHDPDTALLASALDLDLSTARVTNRKSVMMVSGARLKDSGIAANVIWGINPRREIWMLIEKSAVPYHNIKDEIFGANQRIKLSKLSAGFAVVFEIGGWTCGYTASSPDGDLDALFCEEPRPAPGE